MFLKNAFQGFTVGRRHREECTLLEYFNSKLEVFLFVFHFMHLISNGMKVLLTSTTTSMNEQKPYAKRKIKKDSVVIVGNQKDLSWNWFFEISSAKNSTFITYFNSCSMPSILYVVKKVCWMVSSLALFISLMTKRDGISSNSWHSSRFHSFLNPNGEGQSHKREKGEKKKCVIGP